MEIRPVMGQLLSPASTRLSGLIVRRVLLPLAAQRSLIFCHRRSVTERLGWPLHYSRTRKTCEWRRIGQHGRADHKPRTACPDPQLGSTALCQHLQPNVRRLPTHPSKVGAPWCLLWLVDLPVDPTVILAICPLSSLIPPTTVRQAQANRYRQLATEPTLQAS